MHLIRYCFYTYRQTPQKPNYFVFIFGPVSEKKFKYGILRAIKKLLRRLPLAAIRMRDKKRNILRKDWPFLRADIERAKKELDIKKSDFRALNINEWNAVQSNIEIHFLYERPSNVRRSWLWDDLKVETSGIVCEFDPFEKLSLLVNKNEIVYFLVNETVNELTKYWCYEGTIDSIISIICESYGLDEYYLISKKYEWFLCTNHHDVLIGTGTMISKMKENEEKIKKAGNTV